MKKAAVLGFPVRHSLSPRLHNYWIRHHSIDASYEAVECPPEQLADTLKRLQEEGYVGCNLTVPHKEIVLPLLQTKDALVTKVGAANTLVFEQNGKAISGRNTDVYGFMQNLRVHAPALRYKGLKVLLLGAGGAARAAIAGLLDEGVETIGVLNRTPQKIDVLQRDFGAPIRPVTHSTLSEFLGGAGLVVNATSLGMQGQPPLEFSLEGIRPGIVVTDMVYAPLKTPLLTQAEEKGCLTVDGLGMLLYQAVPAFEAWFGIRPEVTEELRKHMLAS